MNVPPRTYNPRPASPARAGGAASAAPREEGPTTSETLLDELGRDPGSVRWEEFAERYAPLIERFVRAESAAHGAAIPTHDRDDLVQETLVAVSRALPSFRYDPARGRFRGYLCRIVQNLASRYRRSLAERREALGLDAAMEACGARAAAARRLDAAQTALMGRALALALHRVFSDGRFRPNTKAVFRRFVVEGRPVGDVAAEFKMRPNAVYQIKDRVLRAADRVLVEAGKGVRDLDSLVEVLAAGAGLSKPGIRP